jgi:hypothetical protein
VGGLCAQPSPPGATCAPTNLVVHEQSVVQLERVVGCVVHQGEQGLEATSVNGRGLQLRGWAGKGGVDTGTEGVGEAGVWIYRSGWSNESL